MPMFIAGLVFGTLYVPQKEREPLIFGVAEHAEGHTR